MFVADRMVLISDSMAATGLGDGKYVFGGLDITVKDGVARTAGGNLAGSTSMLIDCVRCAIKFGIPEYDPFHRAAGYVDGCMSILTGISANKSMASGMPVDVMSLVDIPGYRKIY